MYPCRAVYRSGDPLAVLFRPPPFKFHPFNACAQAVYAAIQFLLHVWNMCPGVQFHSFLLSSPHSPLYQRNLVSSSSVGYNGRGEDLCVALRRLSSSRVTNIHALHATSYGLPSTVN